MGISDGEGGGEGGGGVVDCSVGTIVWVRRRNGSWWPGRILGPEELSASHLMSPRSGTPVKLLGREDASVDWYNLEKSKRVKAFRCGEFDACIERAEASQGIPIKKREKYARREDAILHALQLEREQLEMKHQKLGTLSNGTGHRNSGAHRRELLSFSSDIYARDDEPKVHGKYSNHKSHTFSRKAGFSGEEENKGNTLYVHKGKTSKQSGLEEYHNESLPRMRGLQDFGLRIAPPKKKVSQYVTWEASHKPLDIHVDPLSSVGHIMGDENYTGSSRSSFAIKRKSSQSGNGEVSLVRKRDRRRPLVQVLQSSAKLPVSHHLQPEYDSGDIPMQGERDHMGVICRAKRSRCVYFPADSNDSLDDNGFPSEEMPDTDTQLGIVNSHSLDYSGSLAQEYSSSGLAEETESDSSETDCLEPDLEEDGNLTGTTQTLVPGSKDCEPPVLQASENFRDLDSDEVPLLGYIPPLADQMIDASADGGVSKWHMKGKRNIRNLTKRPTDLMDGKISSNVDSCIGPSKGTPQENMGSSFKMRRTNSSGQRTGGQSFYHNKGSSHFAHDGVDMMEKDLGHKQLMRYGNRRYSFALQGLKDHGRSHSSFNHSDDDSHLLSPTSWRADGPSSHVARRTYWEDSDDGFDPDYADHLDGEMESMLIDVDIQVQKRSYQGEHVPWVSLSSKWNGGKPILGHPVQIEILEDGSTSHFVSRYDFGPEESSIPPAFRRTAKRTVMHRVPRPNPASALEEDADPLNSDQEIKPSPKKVYTGFLNHETKFPKKSSSHTRRPTMPGKFQKNLVKKVNTSSQKTRTLSSLATEQRLGGDGGSAEHSRRSGILDGLIKPEGGIRLVTCVPVKVVFSRILEAVGRPSSGSVHRARLASPAVRGLS